MPSFLLKCCHLWLKTSFQPFPYCSMKWLERSTELVRDPPVLVGKKRRIKRKFQNNILSSPSLRLPFNHTSVTFFLCGKIWCEKQPGLVSDAAEFDHVATGGGSNFLSQNSLEAPQRCFKVKLRPTPSSLEPSRVWNAAGLLFSEMHCGTWRGRGRERTRLKQKYNKCTG